MSILSFLVEASLYLVVFYTIYSLLLYRTTHFTLNRLFLLSSLLISCALPLIQIPGSNSIPAFSIQLPDVIVGQADTAVLSSDFPTLSLLLVLYLSGCLVFFLRASWKAFQLHKILSEGRAEASNGVTFIYSPANIPTSSFYKYIIIPQGTEVHPKIIEHELIHLRQYHSLDLILIQLFQIIFWFHPILIAYQTSIKTIHEYLADEAVAGKTANEYIPYSKIMLQHHMPEVDFGFSNHFNQSFIKKRIMMLKREKSSVLSKLTYLLILPFILLLSTQISCNSQDEISDPGEVFIVVEEMPEFPGGQDAMLQFIYENITYPQEAKDAGLEGMVVVSFVIDQDGYIAKDQITLKKSIGYGMDEESMNVIAKMPQWSPGKQKGKEVSVQFNLPIRFKLEDNKEAPPKG